MEIYCLKLFHEGRSTKSLRRTLLTCSTLVIISVVPEICIEIHYSMHATRLSMVEKTGTLCKQLCKFFLEGTLGKKCSVKSYTPHYLPLSCSIKHNRKNSIVECWILLKSECHVAAFVWKTAVQHSSEVLQNAPIIETAFSRAFYKFLWRKRHIKLEPKGWPQQLHFYRISIIRPVGFTGRMMSADKFLISAEIRILLKASVGAPQTFFTCIRFNPL